MKGENAKLTTPARPQMTDIAEVAGVSLATVDRVINRRKGVKERTRHHVLAVAAELGYMTGEEAETAAAGRPMNIAVLLPAGTNPYLRLLGDRVRARLEKGGAGEPNLRCLFIKSFHAGDLAEALLRQSGWADAIAFFAIEHPEVREAAARVSAAGVKLVTIVSGIGSGNEIDFVGLDNRAVGRTAGLLLGRLSGGGSGSVALVAGSRHYRAHSDREAGFLSILEEMFPDKRVVGMREGHDDAAENYRHTQTLLEQCPDLVGIYNVGGSSGGITRALVEAGRQDIVFIGHGLTPDTRKALIDGTMDAVFDLDPDTLIDRSIARLRGEDSTRQSLKLDIFFRENLP